MSIVLDLIKQRRSIRKYSDIPVEPEKINDIIEAARFAPSATNRQPWRFMVITDKNLIKPVVIEALGLINQWAITAPVLIIGCTVRSNLLTHYIASSLAGVNYHIMDLAIAMENMVLEAQDIGLSTCWIGWFNEKKIKKLLNIPVLWRIGGILTLGYKDPDHNPRTQKRLPVEKIAIIK